MRPMLPGPKRRLWFLAIGGMALMLGVIAGVLSLPWSTPRTASFESIDVSGAAWGRALELTDHTGAARTLADFRGKAVVLTFGFTNCPDVCPTTLAKLAAVVNLLGPRGKDLQVLMVTVDPKRDTPQILSRYVPAFHPTFLGLWGDPKALARTTAEFRVFYEANAPNAAGYYSVNHSAQMFAFDRSGALRLVIRDEATAESIARDLGKLL